MRARRRPKSRLRRCLTSAAAAPMRESARRLPAQLKLRRGRCRPRRQPERTLPKRFTHRSADEAQFRYRELEKVTAMRKLLITILLAGAATSPAFAQDADHD